MDRAGIHDLLRGRQGWLAGIRSSGIAGTPARRGPEARLAASLRSSGIKAAARGRHALWPGASGAGEMQLGGTVGRQESDRAG
ncbi:MAG: hypothetical protein NTU95_10760 [Methanothrix sp.]|nr:hypothetical protein [Methanothrix sp.]